MNFIGLLYLSDTIQKNANLRAKADAIKIYACCAALCAKSFQSAGMRFTLVTNQKNKLDSILADLGLDWVKVEHWDFSLAVPTLIPFYPAHFKLELFSALSTGAFGNKVGLVDIDALLLRPLIIPGTSGKLCVYDISSQVFPAYGTERVIRDLEVVAGQRFTEVRWFGGEFIYGTKEQYQILGSYISRCWPRYLENQSSLHHFGDEMVTSAALNLACADGLGLTDLGSIGEVARWWSVRTQNQQMSFSTAEEVAILHLPADKCFLAEQVTADYSPSLFRRKFRRYVQRRIGLRHVQNTLDRIVGRTGKYVPAL